MSRDFVLDLAPMRVRLRRGAIDDVAAELDHLGLSKALVLSTPEQEELANDLARRIGTRAAGVFPHARMHVPVEVADRAAAYAEQVGADCCVAVGGGSTIGLGKAIALRAVLPVIAVPTTYAGSEMTPIWGLTEGGRKRTGRDRRVLPVSVVYDPELTDGLPVSMSAASGMNAIAHAVEALYAPDRSPLVSLMAERSVTLLARALPELLTHQRDPDGRHDALEGAWLAGACLGATTMGLHHKLCHVFGGTFDLPHAETHATVLPHVAAFNLPHAPEAQAAMRRALGTDDVSSALSNLSAVLGLATRLADLGMPVDGVDRVVEEVLAMPYSNPRQVDGPALRELIDGIVRGRAEHS